MKTFFGKTELKNDLLSQLKHHQELDAFVQGVWLRTDEGKIKRSAAWSVARSRVRVNYYSFIKNTLFECIKETYK